MKPIKDIVSFNPPYKVKKNSEINYVEMAAVTENQREITYFLRKKLSGGRAKFRNGDTLFARISPCLQNGKTCKVSGLAENEIANGSTEFIVLSPKDHSQDEDFIFYTARSADFRASAEKLMEGTTGRQRVSWQSLAEIHVAIPEPEIRKKIGTLLASLDNQIELNKKINQTLEAIAQIIFKSWFVDFDPVHAKSKASSEDEYDAIAQKLGISREILNLFPNEFEESTQELIPKGWQRIAVSQLIQINPLTKLKKGTLTKFVDMKSIPTSGYCIYEIEKKKFNSGMKFQKDDILFSRITPCIENGKTGWVNFLNNNEIGFGSTEFIVLREKDSIHKEFIACLSRLPSFREHCIKNMTGTSGRQRVQLGCFDTYFLTIPGETRLLDIFSEYIHPFFEFFSNNIENTNTLRKILNILLPKLLSGEIDVSHLNLEPEHD